MSAMKEFLSNSYLFGANAPFIEELYEAYLDNPQSVPEQWREYFDKLQLLSAGGNGGRDVAQAPIVEAFAQRAKAGAARPAPAVAGFDRKQVSVLQLIAEYRFRGVLVADIDPLKRHERPRIPELEPAYYDLTDSDMDTVVNTGSVVGPARARRACRSSCSAWPTVAGSTCWSTPWARCRRICSPSSRASTTMRCSPGTSSITRDSRPTSTPRADRCT